MNGKKNISRESFLFPGKDLPPCFSNKIIYDNIDEIRRQYGSLKNMLEDNFILENDKIKSFKGCMDLTVNIIKGTEPLSFVAAKPGIGSRNISIPNPLIQIPLHYYIIENISNILSEQVPSKRNYASNSKYYFMDGEIYIEYDYDGRELTSFGVDWLAQEKYDKTLLKNHKIANGRYYHLHLDVANFFNNIYTHTISWNLKNDSSKTIFSNLDVMLRNTNNNETKGILIGPYTSGLVSEVLMSKIDRKILQNIDINTISYVRYVDDMDCYSDSKEDLENKTKYVIEKELINYKLDINESKLELEEFPFLQLSHLQTQKNSSLKSRIISNEYKMKLECVEDIINEMNTALKTKYSNFKYLVSMLTEMLKKDELGSNQLDAETIEILLDYLINTMFQHNFLTEKISGLIIALFSFEDLSIVDKNRIIKKWINKRNSKKTNLREIVDIWLIYIILTLNIVSEEITNYVLNIMLESEVSAILCIDYLFKNDLIVKKKKEITDYIKTIELDIKNRYGNNWIHASWFTRYWLLFYCDSIKWKMYSIPGFKNTILSKINIEQILKLPEMKKALNIIKLLYENNVSLLLYDDNEPEDDLQVT